MRHRRALRDLDSEMRDHIDRETLANIDRGMAPDRARDAAMRAFGSVLHAAEETRAVWIPIRLDRLRQDVAGGLRNIRRYPLAALVAVLSVGAGTGAATITLVVRDAVFRNAPPAYRDPGQISRVQVGRPDDPVRPEGNRVPAALYTTWQSGLAARFAGSTPQVTGEVRTGDRTAAVPIRAVTPSLFAVLGAEPIIGRSLPASPDANGPPPALLSYRAWQELFDGRTDCVGRSFWIDNQPFVVSGVMPERFWYIATNSPIWTPLDVSRLSAQQSLDVVVRRPAAMTAATLEALLHPGMIEYATHLPRDRRDCVVAVSGIEGTPLGRQVSIMLPYVLATAALLTLLIACANVAVLMITQWAAREHEIAIRAAIGASRGRIVRSLLTESTMIAGIGGLLAVATVFALRAFVLRAGGDAAFYDLSIHPRVFFSTALIVLLTGIGVGLAPALHQTRRLHLHPLRAMAGGDRVRQRWRHALVVFEIAVTVAMLVETCALVDGYRRWMGAPLGFDTQPLLTADVENAAGAPVARLLDAARGLPGIQSAAASTALPFGARGKKVRVAATRGGEALAAECAATSPSFLSVLGVRLRAGRGFAEGERETARTVIVNEALAARLFPHGRPIGATVWIGDVPHTLLGVAANYSNHPLQPLNAVLRVYTPLPATPVKRIGLVARSRQPAPLVAPLRRELRAAAAGTVVSSLYTLDEITSIAGQEILAGTAPLVPLIALGLLLTAAGIYGVLAFAVARRGRELAVRVAVGATGHDLVRLVTAHTLKLVGTGAGVGIGLTFALSRVVRAAGGGGSVYDPSLVAFTVPAILIGVLAFAAAWLPARRASAIDPVVLLRTS